MHTRDTVHTPHVSCNVMRRWQKIGVAGKGNFLTMEDKLKSKAEDSRLLREHVFNRLRHPDYEDLGQANTIYMPRLSGNK